MKKQKYILLGVIIISLVVAGATLLGSPGKLFQGYFDFSPYLSTSPTLDVAPVEVVDSKTYSPVLIKLIDMTETVNYPIGKNDAPCVKFTVNTEKTIIYKKIGATIKSVDKKINVIDLESKFDLNNLFRNFRLKDNTNDFWDIDSSEYEKYPFQVNVAVTNLMSMSSLSSAYKAPTHLSAETSREETFMLDIPDNKELIGKQIQCIFRPDLSEFLDAYTGEPVEVDAPAVSGPIIKITDVQLR